MLYSNNTPAVIPKTRAVYFIATVLLIKAKAIIQLKFFI